MRPNPTPRPNVPRGGTITIGTTTDARSFHPYGVTDTASFAYINLVYEGGLLTEYDPNTLDRIGKAAERWTVSPDGKTFTFTLRDDLKWSDGRQVTAEDYAWTFQQAANPANNYPYRATSIEGPIASYEARDSRTIVVTLKDVIANGIERASFLYPLPKHIWERHNFTDPNANPEINKPTVGCGDWKVQEWRRGESATFLANDLSPEGRPNIDTLVYRIFGNAATAYQALKSGDVDYFPLQPSDYQDAKRQNNINVHEFYSASASWTYLGFNHRRPAFKDIRVRKAVAYATDRKGIIDAVVEGQGKPLYSTYAEESWAYTPNVEKYEFNVGRAEQLFREAGYTKGRDGKLAKDGQPLNLKLLFGPGSNKVREGIAILMQQELLDLGIEVQVVPLEFQAFLDAIKKDPYDYDLYVLGWSSGVDPDGIKVAYLEAQIPSLNSGGYINKQVEDLYARGVKELDRERRKAIYAEIQRILADDLPYVYIYQVKSLAGMNKRVGGVQVTQRLGLNDNNEWFINR